MEKSSKTFHKELNKLFGAEKPVLSDRELISTQQVTEWVRGLSVNTTSKKVIKIGTVFHQKMLI